MLQKQTIDKIIKVLKRDASRALTMRVTGFPAPYYCSFLLRDVDLFETWASAGSIYKKKTKQDRHVFCDMRVGSYRYDQTTEGGLNENLDDLESTQYITVPIDDSNLDGLRMAIWRLSEIKFREALSDYNHKEALRVSTVDPNRAFHSFTPLGRIKFYQRRSLEKVDSSRWVKFCREGSRWMSYFPKIFGDSVDFSSSQETKIFVSSEHRTVVQTVQVYTLSAKLQLLTRDGSHLEQELVFNCGSQDELPDMREFKKMVKRKYDQLIELAAATKIHAFSGPVLLYPQPAGLLFHEATGHRLEGSRLLSSGEGQTFRGQVGKRVFNIDVTIRDNPRLFNFKGNRCIGSYDFDDEGTPASDVVLVENGVLRNFLSTRAAISRRGFTPNGHARNKKAQRPISRMAVTIVEGRRPVSLSIMREMLVREIVRQKKPFGMIVYETSAGETDTSSYDFQAFYGDISYATLVYPDGREEVVRGVNFVGTPMQALNNVIAIGDDQELDNSFCGAESGFIPVSMISPAILLRNLELQAKDEGLVTQYILRRPKRKISRKARCRN